ncbi:MAG: ammonium transporter [Gemmataceae bacterium]
MKPVRFAHLLGLLVGTGVVFGMTPPMASAAEGNDPFASSQVIADTLWVLIAAFLVFFMNTGFGCVEAGFCRAKNATNILGKNFIVFAISSIAFWAVGWTLMFGGGSWNNFVGTQGWFLAGQDNSPYDITLEGKIKEDLSTKYPEVMAKLDWNSEEGKKLQGSLNTFVSEASTAFEDDEAVGKTLELAVTVPGGGEFTGSYIPKEYYWGAYSSIAWAKIPLSAKFFFQLAFAATAATIVSGCVAERIHYGSFMLFAVFIAAISYPITGHWIWGGGWLTDLGFWDFAGSTVVHSVGGWAGLAGIILLGPRLGKYRPDGKVQPIPGHSMALAFLGGMILWLGWFGFNPGSTMAANPTDIAHIVVTTNMAGAAGGIAATITAWVMLGKPDFSMTVNGVLAGLVAITAPCAWVTVPAAILIGAVGGVLVVFAVLFFDRMQIDDPVGALSVHLVNGIWGTLAVGLFAAEGILYDAGGGPAGGLFVTGSATQFGIQLIGVVVVGLFTFTGSMIVWAVLKATVGIRVEREIEVPGLDVTEMGMEAYSGFQVTDPIEHAIPLTEPRAATIPPSGKRFSIVVKGVHNGELMQAWSKMCKPGDTPPPQEFKAIYPYMTTVSDNTFQFRGGDPDTIRGCVQKLFEGRLTAPIDAEVIHPV